MGEAKSESDALMKEAMSSSREFLTGLEVLGVRSLRATKPQAIDPRP